MTILSHVCVDFYDKQQNLIFSVSPNLLNCILTAPDEIQQDPIFDMLLADHSLEAVQTIDQKKRLENDPTEGVTAEGKKPKAARKDTGKDSGKTGSTASPDAGTGAADASDGASGPTTGTASSAGKAG